MATREVGYEDSVERAFKYGAVIGADGLRGWRGAVLPAAHRYCRLLTALADRHGLIIPDSMITATWRQPEFPRSEPAGRSILVRRLESAGPESFARPIEYGRLTTAGGARKEAGDWLLSATDGGSPGYKEVPETMLLKRVSLSGFKSFCDRVDFDFGSGITCIVGPNGCGKSNIVDAFKWVLGEQSARSLRGRQMTDMIFNGSSTRPSSSVAQVDLVFDNSDRSLPTDHEEVTVTRKIYRSGESEYLLNREATRLKDIRELFMDTGVGVDAYSVIEQGRVDSLLQSSPTERRVIFEEAAGISKYKSRRREAERKLERTQQNLLRVADIIEELEKRLRSVKLQAGRARSFLEYQARLNELRSSYAMAEYHRLAEKIEGLTRDANDHTDGVTALRTEIDRHEAEGTQVALRVDALVEEIGKADNQVVQARSDHAAEQERVEAAIRREQEQQALHDRAEERLSADRERLTGASAELQDVQETAGTWEREALELEGRMEEIGEKDRSLARELVRMQAVLDDEKAGIIELLRKSAQTHNEIIRLNTHRESLVGQKGRLSHRDAQITSELESVLERKAHLERRQREVLTLIEAENQKLEGKKVEAQRMASMIAQLVEALSKAKQQRSALHSRQDVLQDLERTMEGVESEILKVLDRKRHADAAASFGWVIGLVADIFEADVVHARMIEAALGESTQCLVVTDGGRFLDYVAASAQLQGRLTALCLDRLPPLINARDFSNQPGFLARSTEFVRFPEKFDRLAQHLLGKTVVVSSLDAAVTMSKLDVAGHRFVTLQGDVVEPDGRIRVGPPASGGGLISRKSELRAIDARLRSLSERIATLVDQIDRAQAEQSYLEGVQQELRTAIYESHTAKIEASTALKNIEETVGRLTYEKPVIAQEATLIEQQINEMLERSGEGGRSLEALEQQNKDREQRVAVHQDRIDELVTVRRQTQESLTQARVDAGQLSEKRAAAADRASALGRAIQELSTTVEAVGLDIEQCRSRIAEAEQAASSARHRVTTLESRIEDLDVAATKLRNERDALRLEMDGRQQMIKTARGRLTNAEEQLHEVKMSLAETNVRRDELVTRVSTEMDIDLADRYANYEHAERDWERVEVEIAELRGKMDRLGNVNLDAINELDEIQERHGFLTSQRDDLNDSRRQLEQLIDKLNNESLERFNVTFERIRDHFRTMFRKLFGGGRADILLEDPENVLECGIEIVAQPPGKELQIISLMSGGEKSLTAIALLMSIFKNRPAPFAILDEVDAALDEANNDRFNRIVREFVKESQFIIITHSKRTMNVGDRLYGVTMQEPGVSTRVGVELAGTNVA